MSFGGVHAEYCSVTETYHQFLVKNRNASVRKLEDYTPLFITHYQK